MSHDHSAVSPTPSSPSHPVPRFGALSTRIRYCECDPMGVAHHAAYIPWLEMGRTELLRESGVTYADLENQGVLLVIVKLEMRYRRAVYYDDLVEVRTTVVGGSRVKIGHTYELVLLDDGARAAKGPREPGTVLAAGATTLAC
ncbi:MAG: acyl-CoA thioesterase, partial [Phycisphaerales bacterium]|nr:acyl-CoA thioesterase [Phycisphaerales bacterium]